MNARKYAAVIPVIPKHNKYLYSLVSELESSSKKFDEIWIIASSQNSISSEEIIQLKRKLNLDKLNIVLTEKQRTAGENRNIGFESVNSDYICFLDADDVYSPHRLAILDQIISSTGAELIYHDYYRLFPSAILSLNRLVRSNKLITTDELALESFSDEGVQKSLEITRGGCTNMLLPRKLRKFHRIQHGHVTVSSKVSERFSSIAVGEDGEFARRCLEKRRFIVYVPLRLSIYDRPTPSNIISSVAMRTLSTLARAKKKLLMSRAKN